MSSFDGNIAPLSHQQLQNECREVGLSASGSSQILRQRLRGWNLSQQRDHNSTKRQKTKSNVADDLVCPITRELPFEPVTAEDGRVYERSAMEQHIRNSRQSELKSPVTNSKMGEKLMPSPQIRNVIEALLATNVITGDLADTWKEKEKEKKEMEDLLRKAKDGDVDAMYQVGLSYKNGFGAFKNDHKLSFEFFEKARHAGCVKGTAHVGRCLVKGRGVQKNTTQGMVFITMAAERGSDVAAYLLGKAFDDGKYGLSVDGNEALVWLQKCLSSDCLYQHMSESQKERAGLDLQAIVDT